MTTLYGMQGQVAEWGYTSTNPYDDPFNDIELDVVFTAGDRSWRVPAYWAGENEWRVRFAAPEPGTYTFETCCSDTGNADLHGVRGALTATPYEGNNPLLNCGPIRVAADKRHFEHSDGTPFFWLGDTWWMGLCHRFRWPDDFLLLAEDRVRKGYTVVQIIAGLYPDMPAFDERGRNEAGFPWEPEYARINPAYFDMADLRIRELVRQGLVPCIVGCWGYFLGWTGIENMKQHWRNIVARWGAYPVVWCLAGEATMSYYRSETPEQDAESQKKGWTKLGRYLREVDPWQRPVTIHPTRVGRDQVEDDSVLDFDMEQTGHSGPETISATIHQTRAAYAREPTMPALVAETNYEGIMHGANDEIQRMGFWGSVLCGAAGYTYGANGIWQVNTREKPFGPSPHGGTWGNQPWEDAYRLPGSQQLGIAKRLLTRYEWHRFEPHPEWVIPHADEENPFGPHAAGIPGVVRVIYFYWPPLPWAKDPVKVVDIATGVPHTAFYFDPRNGEEHALGTIEPEADGSWIVPIAPTMTDWVLVIESGDDLGRVSAQQVQT